MNYLKLLKNTLFVLMLFGLLISCQDILDESLQNQEKIEEIDYTESENMDLMLYGAYSIFYNLQWETFPIISVRGDDVNAAGDQFPLSETDSFQYDRNFWMYNSTWQNLYSDILYFHGAMEEIQKYEDAGANGVLADQYIAEIKVFIGFEMLQLARLWGDLLIPESSRPADLYNKELASFDEVLQYISNLMDEAIPSLPNIRPNQREDLPGGVTQPTALAVKAMANLELNNWQAVADATGAIIGTNDFELYPDYYHLFKISGKLSNEILLELQYSDFGQGSGARTRYLWDFFGPASWDPAIEGAGGGWGFWEPSQDYIEFMLDRGERERLLTTVLFTPDGIQELRNSPNVEEVPVWIDNVSRDNDVFNNHPRYNFLSGKFYLPSNQLTPGRTTYGENNNFIAIRYAEILLMHAEALANGATSNTMSAEEAVNEVRARAGLTPLQQVNLEDVLEEKLAEFATEWGIRFYDLVRYDKFDQLEYGQRKYNPVEDRFLPYPLPQQDLLPQLRNDVTP